MNIQSNARLNAGTFEAGRVSGGTSDGVRINVDGGTLHAVAGTNLHSGALITYSAGSMSTGFTSMTSDARVNLTPGGNKVLRVAGLSMTGTSKIDLNDNDMIVGSITTSKSQVETFVRNGRNGGTWDGASGITSTAAKNATPKNKTLGVLSGARVHQRRRQRLVQRPVLRRRPTRS